MPIPNAQQPPRHQASACPGTAITPTAIKAAQAASEPTRFTTRSDIPRFP
jgi:hypothetical protein